MKKSVKGIVVLGTVLLFTCALITNITTVSAKNDYYNNVEWLENNGFDNSSFWTSELDGAIEDDFQYDVNHSINSGAATFYINGSKGGYVLEEEPPLIATWEESQNPEFIEPDIHGINETGCYIGHEYWEGTTDNYFGVPGNQTKNFPSMNWVHTVVLPVNMSDYIITSASVYALVNGSGDTNLETPGDELNDFAPIGYLGVGDYARFSIHVADPNNIENYRIAYNKTTTLGRDIAGSVANTAYGDRVYLNDTELVPVDEDLLILYLTKILQYDYTNFSIILGIDAYCEDNYNNYDRDTFYDLRIKNFSLSFTYEKKIDQFTTASFTQEGNTINATTITDASMSFDYKIDLPWPTLSPNSEIQTFINGKQYSEIVKLDTFNSTYQTIEFSLPGLRDLITPNQSINVTFQLFIADEFRFGDNVTISIDNVHFRVSYMVYTPDPIPEIPDPGPDYGWLAGGLGSALGVGTIALIMWQAVFKYPVHVRKIRNVRRKIRRGGSTKPLNVKSRADNIGSLTKSTIDLGDLKVKGPPKHL